MDALLCLQINILIQLFIHTFLSFYFILLNKKRIENQMQYPIENFQHLLSSPMHNKDQIKSQQGNPNELTEQSQPKTHQIDKLITQIEINFPQKKQKTKSSNQLQIIKQHHTEHENENDNENENKQQHNEKQKPIHSDISAHPRLKLRQSKKNLYGHCLSHQKQQKIKLQIHQCQILSSTNFSQIQPIHNSNKDRDRDRSTNNFANTFDNGRGTLKINRKRMTHNSQNFVSTTSDNGKQNIQLLIENAKDTENETKINKRCHTADLKKRILQNTNSQKQLVNGQGHKISTRRAAKQTQKLQSKNNSLLLHEHQQAQPSQNSQLNKFYKICQKIANCRPKSTLTFQSKRSKNLNQEQIESENDNSNIYPNNNKNLNMNMQTNRIAKQLTNILQSKNSSQFSASKTDSKNKYQENFIYRELVSRNKNRNKQIKLNEKQEKGNDSEIFQDSFQYYDRNQPSPGPGLYNLVKQQNLTSTTIGSTFSYQQRFKTAKQNYLSMPQNTSQKISYPNSDQKISQQNNSLDHVSFGTSKNNLRSQIKKIQYCQWNRPHFYQKIQLDYLNSQQIKAGTSCKNRYKNKQHAIFQSCQQRFETIEPFYNGPDFYNPHKSTLTYKTNLNSYPSHYFTSQVPKGLKFPAEDERQFPPNYSSSQPSQPPKPSHSKIYKKSTVFHANCHSHSQQHQQQKSANANTGTGTGKPEQKIKNSLVNKARVPITTSLPITKGVVKYTGNQSANGKENAKEDWSTVQNIKYHKDKMEKEKLLKKLGIKKQNVSKEKDKDKIDGQRPSVKNEKNNWVKDSFNVRFQYQGKTGRYL